MRTPPARVAHPLVLVVAAAVLFGIVNVAWRLGSGSVATLAATRAVAGLVLFAPLVVTVARSGALRALTRDRLALVACLLSGSSLWTAAFLFRSVPGPLAATVIGVSPVVVLVAGRAVGSRAVPPRAAAAIVVCTAAGLVAAGPAAFTVSGLVPAVLFLGTDVASVLGAEAARRRHGASALTVGGLIVGAAPAPFLWLGVPAATGGLAVAVVVAALGTAGRFLRSHALGSVSAAAVTSSTQVTALVTALGGVWLFADQFTLVRLAALVAACGASVLALTWSAPTQASATETGGPNGSRRSRAPAGP